MRDSRGARRVSAGSFCGPERGTGLADWAVQHEQRGDLHRVSITNGVSTNTYQIDTKVDLNTNVPWVGSITGIVGQTYFLIPLGPEHYMFFRALDCDDCDHDGVKNWADADPNSSNVLGLTITILSPTNGATIY